jgi:hypothetical protein
MSTNDKNRDISFNLWAFLWMVTLLHFGQILWAILLTVPGCQFPPNWTDNLGHGANSFTYWLYIIVLVANILWETWFKGSQTYVPSSFPFPDMLYANVAVSLWAVLWIFARWGSSEAWFAMPDWLGLTLKTSLFLVVAQNVAVKFLRNPEGYLNKFKEAIEVKDDALIEENPTPVRTTLTPAPKSGNPVVVSPAKPASKRSASANSDLTAKLLDYVRQNGQTKTGALVTALGSPRRSIIRSLNKLIEDGHLVREGNGPGAVYRVSDRPKE